MGTVLLLGTAWVVLVLFGVLHGWLWAPIAPRGDAAAFVAAARAEIDRSTAGNCVLVLLRDGEIAATVLHARGEPIGLDARFQMASMSKWVTAWGVLRLVDQGRIDLDAPVDRYLRRWHLPPAPPGSALDNRQVTVRRLLSHTAGLGDRLGFKGFPAGQTPPSLIDELRDVGDPMPGAGRRIAVEGAPGGWQYSGGGYLILQLLIEDVTGEDFATWMHREVLVPLGMHDSTFDAASIPDSRLAPIYTEQGQPAPRYRFSALAAASLYSTAGDVTRFALAHMQGTNGEAPGRGVLRPASVIALSRPEALLYGLPLWGLGVRLHAPDGHGGFVFGHDGQNYPALHHTGRIDPTTRSGIVVLASGDNMLASRLGEDWVYWHTGRGDHDTLRMNLARLLVWAGAGIVSLILAAVAIAMWQRQRAAGRPGAKG